ncbi:murein transglycosylase [Actinocrispum wychmicini]|nr:murein transglycosylase [Actinocrispum wychmicini]
MSSSPPVAPPLTNPSPPRRRGLPKLLVIGLLLGVVAAVVLVLRDTGDKPPTRRKPADFPVPELTSQPREAAPFQAKPVDPNTVGDLARKMNIPQRALQAYATAEIKLRQKSPKCGISWTMLAGIGRKESMHGRYGGATIGDDGKLSQPIIGVPLDGSPGVRAIKDTDKGELDGDPTWDRAVGPMQFLPATWRKWAARASEDGAPPDPQNIDDAALSAGRYLCAVGGDVTTAAGWWTAVLTYNSSVRYGQEVFNGQDAYARAS